MNGLSAGVPITSGAGGGAEAIDAKADVGLALRNRSGGAWRWQCDGRPKIF